jgi:spermidine/putrescine transport system substrate-binding protein
VSRTDRPAAASVLVPTATAERVGRTLARRRSVLTALASAAALAACGGNSSGSAGTSVDGKVEDSLNVYSWADYDDPDVLKAFGETGPRLQVDSYGSNEEMLAKLVAANGASGYDIVVPTGVYVPQMSSNGLLAELDHGKLKNFGNIDPAYLGQSWDPENKYSVPKAGTSSPGPTSSTPRRRRARGTPRSSRTRGRSPRCTSRRTGSTRTPPTTRRSRPARTG